ncbi:MAG: glycoside hydrolase family 25 protein [Candidatus Aminicenantes bacterium]|nr:glycoside hydrolase family 25 protein [Candidatus Aminicenantes bacterium]
MSEKESTAAPVTNGVVDLSHFNKTVDFKAAKQDGILGVIHKATQGTGFIDPLYHSRREEALKAGLLWGAYHFGSGGNGENQAKFFLGIVNPAPTDLLILDFEQDFQGDSMTVPEAEAFVSYVQKQTNRWPGLYGGSYLKKLSAGKSEILSKCWLWLAEYGSHPVLPAGWDAWTLWQHTDGKNGPQPHSVKGIGACDRDKFNGDSDALKKHWHQGS